MSKFRAKIKTRDGFVRTNLWDTEEQLKELVIRHLPPKTIYTIEAVIL